jgi:4-carboxymuconolactone decarboxylase
MRLTKARITPLPDSEFTDEQRAQTAHLVERKMLLDVTRTMMRRPEAAVAFRPWGAYVFNENSLPPRQREIVILRTGILCRSGYEWAQHAIMGVDAGLTPEEVERVKQGATAPGWSASDVALIKLADELHADQFVTDPTWAELKRHFSDGQCMDAVFAAAQYTQVSMILNTFGVQLDAGLTLDPDLKAY